MKSYYEQNLREVETEHMQEKCTHKFQSKDCLTRVNRYTYQCLVCGKTIYKGGNKNELL